MSLCAIRVPAGRSLFCRVGTAHHDILQPGGRCPPYIRDFGMSRILFCLRPVVPVLQTPAVAYRFLSVPVFILVALLCAQASAAEFELRQDIEFARPDDQRLTLDAYLLKSEARHPCVIYVHGGGFTGGDKEDIRTGFREIRDLCLDSGCHVISVNYRLAPMYPFPAAPDDVLLAIAFVRKHADEYRTDADRLCLMGASAGGMIVSHCGVKYTPESRVAGVISFFGEHDFVGRVSEDPCASDGRTAPRPPGGCISGGMAAFLGFGELKTDAQQKVLEAATCVNHVHRDMPKYLLIHGTRDYGVPIEQSHSMQQAMERVGAKAELVAIVSGGHGIGGWKHPNQLHYRQKLVDWLKRNIVK